METRIVVYKARKVPHKNDGFVDDLFTTLLAEQVEEGGSAVVVNNAAFRKATAIRNTQLALSDSRHFLFPTKTHR